MSNFANSTFWRSVAAGFVASLFLIGIGLILNHDMDVATPARADGGFTKLRAIEGTTREIFYTTSNDARTVVFWNFDMSGARGGDYPTLHGTEIFAAQ